MILLNPNIFYEQENLKDENEEKEFDFEDYQTKVCKLWVDEVNKICPDWLKFEYESLHSPKYYNFETDSIYTKTTVDTIDLMVFVCESKNYEKFNQYCIDNFTSRDGFISFFPNTADEFLDLLKDNNDDEKYYNHIIDFVVNLLNDEIDESEQVQQCVYENLHEIELIEVAE